MSKANPGIKKITTVWLEPDPYERIKIFWCFNCKSPIVEYSGQVTQIVPGSSPYTPSVIVMCKGDARINNSWEKCGHRYVFEKSTNNEIKFV